MAATSQPDPTNRPSASASTQATPTQARFTAASTGGDGHPAIRYEQRLAAGQQLLADHRAVASIQLFYTEPVSASRMEGFLRRAERLGKLSEIYLLPARLNDKEGLRILYGAYPSIDEAQLANNRALPQRYQKAFATTIYSLR